MSSVIIYNYYYYYYCVCGFRRPAGWGPRVNHRVSGQSHYAQIMIKLSCTRSAGRWERGHALQPRAWNRGPCHTRTRDAHPQHKRVPILALQCGALYGACVPLISHATRRTRILPSRLTGTVHRRALNILLWPIIRRWPCCSSRCPYSCSSSTAWAIRSATGWTRSVTTTPPGPCSSTWCTTSSPDQLAPNCSSSDATAWCFTVGSHAAPLLLYKR